MTTTNYYINIRVEGIILDIREGIFIENFMRYAKSSSVVDIILSDRQGKTTSVFTFVSEWARQREVIMRLITKIISAVLEPETKIHFPGIVGEYKQTILSLKRHL
jgi:hypothetical protein